MHFITNRERSLASFPLCDEIRCDDDKFTKPNDSKSKSKSKSKRETFQRQSNRDVSINLTDLLEEMEQERNETQTTDSDKDNDSSLSLAELIADTDVDNGSTIQTNNLPSDIGSTIRMEDLPKSSNVPQPFDRCTFMRSQHQTKKSEKPDPENPARRNKKVVRFESISKLSTGSAVISPFNHF